MSTIHENLRQIRSMCGMTQEEAASRIHVTRQAISSYESGRTQPDLDTLKRLADAYGVSIQEVLYGNAGQQRQRRAVKGVALAALLVLVLGSFLQSGFLWGANAFFPIELGPVPEANLPIVEMHFRFAGASTLAASISSGLFRLLLLALLFLLATLESPAGLRKKLLYWGVLVVGGICPVLPFMLADSTYQPVDYLYFPIRTLLFAAVVLAVSFPLEALVRKFRPR